MLVALFGLYPAEQVLLTDLSSVGWSLAMCPRIIPTTWSSLSALATYPHSHLMSFIVVPRTSRWLCSQRSARMLA
jgi:hypothetical protein